MTIHEELKETYNYYSKAPKLWSIIACLFLTASVSFAVANLWIALYISIPVTITAIVCASLYIARYIKVIKLEYKAQKSINNEVESPHYAQLFEGEPGSGKSDLAKRLSVYKSDYMTEELYFENKYYDALNYKEGTIQQQQDYKEVSDTVNFYADKSNIKHCLCWNVPGIVDGKNLFEFEYEMALQLKRIAYRTVIVIDEVDTPFPNSDSILKIEELIEMFKYDRQFGLFTFYMTTQNKTSPILALRNVCTNYTILKFTKIMEPTAIVKKYKLCRAKFMSENNPEKSIILAKKIRALKERMDSIGFIAFERINRGGTENNIVQDTRDNTVILPFKRRYDSYTRMFREIYKCKDKPIEMKVYEDNVIKPEEWRKSEERRKELRRALKARATKEKSPNAKKQ